MYSDAVTVQKGVFGLGRGLESYPEGPKRVPGFVILALPENSIKYVRFALSVVAGSSTEGSIGERHWAVPSKSCSPRDRSHPGGGRQP